MPASSANEVLYRHGSLSEFYRTGPYGLEQGFTLQKRPQTGTGPLVLSLSLDGSLTPEQAGSQILFRSSSGASALRYGQLSAVDATGRKLPARMELLGGRLQLSIDDGHARYPVRIDPFLQQGEALRGGGEVGGGRFGSSVALSPDGNIALIGAPGDNANAGAAWVFKRSPEGTWVQQGEKLTGGGEVGKGRFGAGVAISSEGNTLLIGAPEDNGGVGAAWSFTRSGSTWTQQGEKLTGPEEVGDGLFGASVALSYTGTWALIGGPLDNNGIGAAWSFFRFEGAWSRSGEKLTGAEEVGEGHFGASVALSEDANTALVGGPWDNHSAGAAWAFGASIYGWHAEGEKLTGSEEENGEAGFGSSVALSGDGTTALVGGPWENMTRGAAWFFIRSGGLWSQQGPRQFGTGAHRTTWARASRCLPMGIPLSSAIPASLLGRDRSLAARCRCWPGRAPPGDSWKASRTRVA